MIMILSSDRDQHAKIVAQELGRRGISSVWIDPGDFPAQAAVSLAFNDSDGDGCSVAFGGRELPLSGIKTIWYRRPNLPAVSEELEPDDREFARLECRQFLGGLWQILADRFWISYPDRIAAASYKPFQLHLARRLGFEIPRTLMTNDPAQVARFFRRCGENAVYKTFTQHSRTRPDGRAVSILTNRLEPKNLENLEGVRQAPCIFQEYVSKRIEIRVTVMGRRVFAAEIHSQDSEVSRIDWRRYDLDRTPYRPHVLPTDIERRCLDLVENLGLAFGCIDLILTPEGRYVFLEINPNGQWLWVESLTGQPMLAHFVEMLSQATVDYIVPPTPVRV